LIIAAGSMDREAEIIENLPVKRKTGDPEIAYFH
jgi:hypothetical protein